MVQYPDLYVSNKGSDSMSRFNVYDLSGNTAEGRDKINGKQIFFKDFEGVTFPPFVFFDDDESTYIKHKHTCET